MRYLILIMTLVLISGCTNPSSPKNFECTADSECAPTGCSSQVCAPAGEDIITTCEYKNEYQCLEHTACGCINNKCAWTTTQGYLSCLESLPKQEEIF